jgi:hypothetical protein
MFWLLILVTVLEGTASWQMRLLIEWQGCVRLLTVPLFHTVTLLFEQSLCIIAIVQDWQGAARPLPRAVHAQRLSAAQSAITIWFVCIQTSDVHD